MLDTAKMFHPHRLLEAEPPKNWFFRESHKKYPPGSSQPENERSFSYDHAKNGMHVYGKHSYGAGSEIQYLSASLPRLLHGDNGKLIKNQEELENSLKRFREVAGEIGAPLNPGHYTRVDLVWQFQGDTADYIRAHRNCRHPRIRIDPVCLTERSMVFRGSEVQIKFYDKTLEAYKRNGDIVRVEVQLHGRRLKEELGEGDRVTTLTFDKCYQAYRRILLGFKPTAIPKVSGKAEFLAVAEKENWRSGGVPAFDLYTKDLSKKQVRRLKAEMASLRPLIHQIDWAQLLPAEGPPPPIEVF